MKKLKYFCLYLSMIVIASCGKNFGDINVDPNNPSAVPPEFLLTNAEKYIARYDPWFTGMVFSQHIAMSNYTEPSRYLSDLDLTWGYEYSIPLQDLTEIIRLVTSSDAVATGKAQNQVAIARVLKAYNFHLMTDIWGPIPYSQALRGDQNRSPAYDSQRDIYMDILKELNEAIAQMDESAGSYGPSDVIYGGDVTKWKKFAHSLILRVAMRMSDAEPSIAQAEVEAASQFAFTDNSDNANFVYLSGPPNNNPINEDRNLRIDADYGSSDILIDKTLKPLADPRLPFYVDERLDGGGYFGRPFGQSSPNAASELPDIYSQPSGSAEIRNGTYDFKPTDVVRPEAPYTLMSYAEVCFIQAEAKERGWNVPGSAEEWYNAGVLASMDVWGVDAASADDYLLQADVAYSTAAGDWKQKIGVQKWIALYMQGMQAWAEWRRLDFDKLELPVDGVLQDVGDKVAPVRMIYPTGEQSQNRTGYDQGVSLLGGPDKLFTRLWWDTQ